MIYNESIRFVIILGECLKKCCIDHGLPVQCINEEIKTHDVSYLNDTHSAVEIILSDDCHEFDKILQDCKDDCIPPKKGKYRVSFMDKIMDLRR